MTSVSRPNGADKGYSHGTGVLIFAFARAVLGTNKKNFQRKTKAYNCRVTSSPSLTYRLSCIVLPVLDSKHAEEIRR